MSVEAMKKVLVIFVFAIIAANSVLLAQTCETNGSNTIFDRCAGFDDEKPSIVGNQATYDGNYTITVKNNNSITINGYAIINGTLTIDFGGNNGFLRIPAGDTLYVTNLTFTNVNPVQEKVLDVDGVLIVTGTLNFSDDTIEIDGGGSVSAGTVVGSGGTSCTGGDGCPNPFSAGSCSPAGSGLCSETGVLPIELADFHAEVKQHAIELAWATLSEEDFHYFSLQRSSNGRDFVEIAQVMGNGNSFERRDYNYQDDAPLFGRSYYRISAVDFDGYSESFDVIAVDFSGKKIAGVYPNPSRDGKIMLHLSFTPQEYSQVQVTITDLAGVVKSEFRFFGSKTELDLECGTYLLKVNSGLFNQVIRVVIL